MISYIERRIKSGNISLMTGLITVMVVTIMIVTIVIAMLSYRSISSLSSINELSIQKNEELKKVDKLVSNVRDLHTDVNDFVITGDSSYINNTERNRDYILTYGHQFANSLQDNGAKQKMSLLNDLIERNLAYNQNIIKLYKLGGRDITLQFIETGKASVLNDSIELIATSIKEFENHEFAASVKKYNAAATQTQLTIRLAAALIIVMGFVFMITSVRNLQRRAIIFAELEKAKNVSEKTALLKTQFMSNMSHEIRTPLNSIIGFTNILANTKMDAQQSDFVKTIKTASENLLGIVNDVLDFSKIEAGKMQLEDKPFSIDELLDNLRRLFDHSARERKLKLEVRCDESVPPVCVGDSVRLNQILINLVGNAIKFTEKGSVAIKVKAREIVDGNITLEFSVKDTGVGISREKMPKIFERFEQIDNKASRKHYGTGLGLSIVKSLVEMSGGVISVTSIPDAGTEFVFTVIYRVPAVNSGTLNDNNKATGLFPFAPGTKILLVEDNPVNQKLAGFFLNEWKIAFDIAGNGKLACDMLKANAYDLVLMDIQMPEMDGYEAAGIIRKEMKLNVPIVALTAHVLQTEIEKFAQAGMDGHLTKPFKEEELYAVLAKYLKRDTTATPEMKTGREVQQVIDFAEVGRITNGNKIFLKEMAETFVVQVNVDLGSLSEACNKGDIKLLNTTAHNMKSTVGYMGLTGKLENALNRLESATTFSSLTVLHDVEHIKSVCRDAVKQLEVKLPELTGSSL